MLRGSRSSFGAVSFRFYLLSIDVDGEGTVCDIIGALLIMPTREQVLCLSVLPYYWRVCDDLDVPTDICPLPPHL